MAKVVSVEGKVDTQYAEKPVWTDLHLNDTICTGARVRTERWSRAVLVLGNEAVINLSQNATLDFPEPEKPADTFLLKIKKGIAYFRSRQTQSLDVQTPFINAVHRGTEFMVAVDDQQTQVTVFDGSVAATNANGQILINQGETGIGQKDQRPHLQTLTISPQDAVQWALYYPPVIDLQDPHASTQAQIKSALAAYQQGDVHRALEQLSGVAGNSQDTDYLTVKASLLLTVGRVDEAQEQLQLALKSQHNHSTALALQAIIAVAKNQQQDALVAAQQAVQLDPQSATAQIALSYAQQSLMRIPAALQASLRATELAPKNALAWARLAELQLSTGDYEPALASAQTAQSLNPKLANTQTIKGFADLGQVHADLAEQTFTQAIALDSANPLPRIGLALAKIRNGKLQAGKQDLEAAVNLSPDSAIARSYLGKAYYELRNKDYADTEFKLAKSLDSKDPTPWFYDALLKQTTNRPIEALHDMQQAMALNDNRAIYRSSLLLDKDQAARSAAQARIYNDLGFQQLGLLEGWKSVNQDPSNYSAHRLLADNYAALPRHEFARVSELLQSQLLQPVNITPIQPNLAETNLFILNSLGPSDFSYNEYNPLFEYNRYALQASGLVGGNNTYGDNVALSGLYDNISFSLGQFHYETNGFRDNNFLKKDLYNAFLQARVTEKLNLQGEFRHEERYNGDLTQNFYNSNFSDSFSKKSNIDTYRLGGRYVFSPQSTLIGSFIYQDINIDQEGIHSKGDDLVSKQTGTISELQHNYTQSGFNMLTGFGYIDQEAKNQGFFLGFPRTLKPNVSDISKANVYNYTKFNINNALRATAGFSADFYNQTVAKNDYEKNLVHPKLGIEWNPWSSTTLRAAAFRAMSFTRTQNQTLEPTQVAGFNQLYDDRDRSVFWRYGVGIDHKLNQDLAVGVEYSERKLDVPVGDTELVDKSEQLARAYIYYAITNYLTINTEYFYERIDQNNLVFDVDSSGLFHIAQTHRIPITINLFSSNGLSLKIKNTLTHQSGLFQESSVYNSQSFGVSDFYLLDLNLSYRLPKRYGMISVGVNNVLDTRFNYQNTTINANEVLFAPSRLIFSKITLAF
ncbi:MAG: TonB-dependent receptor [Methylococcaceae bacterium]|nr:TonB-dependent receptor [Methylococcaceae bacterium]